MHNGKESPKSLDRIHTMPDTDSPWSGRYKIPWDEPGFSRRMLAEHLSQEHDLASRRLETVDAQVKWIHERICCNEPKRLLDLACGPGFYLKGFTDLGHTCKGIDFSPASVEYAGDHLPETCPVVLGDLRTADFGGGFDVATMIFGEFNVFSPGECASVLRKAYDALVSGGTLLIEPQAFEAVERTGRAPNSWYKADSGLFSGKPHLCLTESCWIEEQAAALQVFHIVDTDTGFVEQYRNTTKAWTDEEIRSLLSEAGFADVRVHEDWPSKNDDLRLFTAKK